MNPVSSFDGELGLWVRAVAIGDGKDTVVLTVVDGEGCLCAHAALLTSSMRSATSPP